MQELQNQINKLRECQNELFYQNAQRVADIKRLEKLAAFQSFIIIIIIITTLFLWNL